MAQFESQSHSLGRLAGSFHIDETPQVLSQLNQWLSASPDRAKLDISDLETVSSVVLSILLSCKRAAVADNKSLAICGASQRLYDMARVGGLEVILGLDPNSALSAETP